MTNTDIANLTKIFNDVYVKLASLDAEFKALPHGLTPADVEGIIQTHEAAEPTLDPATIPTPTA